MEQTTNLTYTVDACDRLVAVDAAFREFALANEWPEGAGSTILGCELWSFFEDPETRVLWRSLFARARAGRPVAVTIRCDAPEARRLFELRLSSSPRGDVTIESRTLSETSRARAEIWSRAVPRGADPLRACSWCKRIRTGDGRWLEVEEAVETLGLLRGPALPLISHGICPDCDREVRRAAGLGTSGPG